MSRAPRVGDVVILVLSEQVAGEVNRRRAVPARDGRYQRPRPWHPGAQAHVGSPAREGDEVPMVVTRVFICPRAAGTTYLVNGQALLDGSDSYWARDAPMGDWPGAWRFRDGEA